MEFEKYDFSRIQFNHQINNGIGFRYKEERLVVIEAIDTVAEELVDLLAENRELLTERQEELCRDFDCDFLLLTWKEQEEDRCLFFSNTKRVRALEFLDYLISEFGLVKGDANVASGRIATAILKVQMAGLDLTDTMEFMLKMTQSYFEDCDWIEAGDYAQQHILDIQAMQKYTKKQIPWAYVKSLDVAEEGNKFFIKSLENESGLTITAGADTYIMIGCRGEIYDISRKKFESTYEETDQVLDVFEMMLDFLPAVETIPEGEYISLDETARLCYPKRGKEIYACQLDKRTKVFPVNKNQEYFLGRPGDYMAVRPDDYSDIYIIQREIFSQTYEEV